MQRNEIGSEFYYVETYSKDNINDLFPDDCKWFISGTAALEYILDELSSFRNVRNAAIPSWCCDSMIIPFKRREIGVSFFPVYLDDENCLVCDYSSTQESDITLVMSYFGYTQEKCLDRPSGIIIRDITHSLLSNTDYNADYYFGSLRKWTGVWTGGFAYKKGNWIADKGIPVANANYVCLRKKAMDEKSKYIAGLNNQKHYLIDFEMAENYLDNCKIEGGTARDTAVARRLDVETIRETRVKNAEYLLQFLSQYAIFPNLKETDCPMFVPIVLENKTRNLLGKYLVNKSIYCPIHWPISGLHVLDEKTEVLFSSELSIVCDQRYGIQDMERIVSEIKRFGLI